VSQENIELLRRALPESAPADMGALLEIVDEQVVWD
jgi:hypothetical protein